MITSTQNEKIKQLLRLMQEKDVLCLDNPKLIKEAQKSGFEIIEVLKTENVNLPFSDSDILVSENVLNKFTNTKTSQGTVAFVRYKKQEFRKPRGNFLILDRVQDPGNVGTLIRSAVGSGFLDIYLVSCASVTNNKTIRSTMGAIFKANIFEVDDSFVDNFKSFKHIYTTDMNGENIYQMSFDENCGIIIGNEGQGVSEKLASLSTKTICIPMQNNLESLNAAVSGSIIMYQITNGGKNVRS